VASLRDVRRRIRSVQKTQQITTAMRMVAAAKLRRAQDAIIAARPYSRSLFITISEVQRRQQEVVHPLLEVRSDPRSLEIVVITSDRGLCGAFNANALKDAERVWRERSGRFERVAVTPVGRKALDFYRKRRPGQIPRHWAGIPTVEHALAQEIAEHLAARYVSGEVDEVVVVGNEFVSALTQTPRALTVLPFSPEGVRDYHPDGGDVVPFSMEPDAQTVLDALVPRALEFTIYRALLENQAGEYAARMTAMESASRNTEELIEALTLQFNRVRQAAITKELMEIVSGAEALA
jgi:F-type H+-transporting ATPase subunit gamma